ncbi:MAG: uridylate kinase, partial [Planctomycetes bacterium SM23_65]
MTEGLRYKRVLLKISGASFGSEGAGGIDLDEVEHLARRIKSASQTGAELAVV